jgi:hypothetical protein
MIADDLLFTGLTGSLETSTRSAAPVARLIADRRYALRDGEADAGQVAPTGT